LAGVRPRLRGAGWVIGRCGYRTWVLSDVGFLHREEADMGMDRGGRLLMVRAWSQGMGKEGVWNTLQWAIYLWRVWEGTHTIDPAEGCDNGRGLWAIGYYGSDGRRIRHCRACSAGGTQDKARHTGRAVRRMKRYVTNNDCCL